jgi:predicted phage terminase large subunit-like protein
MELSLRNHLAERRTFLDPAGGGVGLLKSGLARSALVTVARDQWNRIWVLDAWAERATTTEIVNRLIEHYHHWNPGIVGIEVAGQQRLFVDAVQDILRLRGEHIPLTGVQVSTRVDKLYRIRTILQPVIAQHRLMIRTNLTELRQELGAFPTGQTVDLVDALASAIGMLPSKLTPADEESGTDLYAEHLRDCGLPEDEICARIEEDGLGDDLDLLRRR